jgi:hypothetical protein
VDRHPGPGPHGAHLPDLGKLTSPDTRSVRVPLLRVWYSCLRIPSAQQRTWQVNWHSDDKFLPKNIYPTPALKLSCL